MPLSLEWFFSGGSLTVPEVLTTLEVFYRFGFDWILLRVRGRLVTGRSSRSEIPHPGAMLFCGILSSLLEDRSQVDGILDGFLMNSLWILCGAC